MEIFRNASIDNTRPKNIPGFLKLYDACRPDDFLPHYSNFGKLAELAHNS